MNPLKNEKKSRQYLRFSEKFVENSQFFRKNFHSLFSRTRIQISTYSRRRDCTKMNRNKEMHSRRMTRFTDISTRWRHWPASWRETRMEEKSFAIYSFSLYHRTDNQIILSRASFKLYRTVQGPASHDHIVRADLNVKDTWKILPLSQSMKQVIDILC